MQIKLQQLLKTLLYLFIPTLILCYPKESLFFAARGLTSWFDHMVPALFPFMILTTLMIRQNMTDVFASFLSPVLGRLYRLPANGIYCIVSGFLCGFPIGAKTIAELYSQNKLSSKQAELLLGFCNNIGPVYFISFLLPAIGLTDKKMLPFFLFGMYGIPLLYGLILCRISIRKEISYSETKLISMEKPVSFLDSLDIAIHSAINGITVLGGYMILFNTLNILPLTCSKFSILPDSFISFTSCLIEITGGIITYGKSIPIFILCILPLGGVCCILQTYSMIKHTNLSMKKYLIHKLAQTLLTTIYYLFLLPFLL